MIYEVLKSKGHAHEKGRHHKASGQFIVKYNGERPKQYEGYESVFKGNPEEMMDWLHPRQEDFGVKVERKKVEAPVLQLLVTTEPALPTPVEVEKVVKKTISWEAIAEHAAALAVAGSALAAYLLA